MAQAMARVGIVMRTRDRPLFVTRALDSVLAQTFGDWHVVLVNDGGDPGLLRARIAAAGLETRLPPARMTILDHPAPQGRAAAFNRGLAALRTEFVACLDDDDTWEPEFLQALMALWDRTAPLVANLGGVAAGVTARREDLVTDADGGQRLVALGEDGLPNSFRRTDFLINPIAYATYRHDLYAAQWVLDRAAVAATGGFPEEFEVMEDRAFLLRFLQHWRIATLARPLANHHRRIRRCEDRSQSAAMNTIDNPSYDWRVYADLALPPVSSPPGDTGADLPGLLRAVGTSIVKELNDETSALWHKIDGEARALSQRLAALEARLGAAPPPEPALPGLAPVWSLWEALGDRQIGFGLEPDKPFIGRLSLSYAGPSDGLLLHADPATRTLILQVPDTQGWCALELDLTGLAAAGGGLECALVAGLDGGGLIETGLVTTARLALGRVQHAVTQRHVHALPAVGAASLSRRFEAADLTSGHGHKLTIVLPRRATNLRLQLRALAVCPV